MNKKVIYTIGIVLGAVAGFLYWHFVGCASGTCPLTSKWYTSSAFGGVFGYLFSSMIVDKREKSNKPSEDGKIQPGDK